MDDLPTPQELLSWTLSRENGGVLLTIRRNDGWHLHINLGDEGSVRRQFTAFLSGTELDLS